MTSWRDTLKAQYEDLQRLEELDKELDSKNVTANVDKLLQRPISSSASAALRGSSQKSGRMPQNVVTSDDIEPEPQPNIRPYPLTTNRPSSDLEELPTQYQQGDHTLEFNFPQSYTSTKLSPNKSGITLPINGEKDDQFEEFSRPYSARSNGGDGKIQAQGMTSPDISKAVDSTGR